MNEKVINLGYTTYLQKPKKKWTSNIKNIISKHKIATLCIAIVLMCIIMNLMLVYNFFKILEQGHWGTVL